MIDFSMIFVSYATFLLLTVISISTGTERKIVVKPVNLDEEVFFHIVEPNILSYFYRVRVAKDFGTKFNFTLNHIPLVVIDPPHACSHGINNAHRIQGNVALVLRGQCSFVTKTLNAETAGAIAVIIADNAEEDADVPMVDMVHDGTDRRPSIPAFYMLGKSGQMIRLKLKELGIEEALIDIPVNSTSIPYNIHVHQPPWSIW